MKYLRRDILVWPESWRVKYYGFSGDDEGYFTVTVIAPRLEDVFAVVRKECDDTAIFVSVSQSTAYFSDRCFDPDDSLCGMPQAEKP